MRIITPTINGNKICAINFDRTIAINSQFFISSSGGKVRLFSLPPKVSKGNDGKTKTVDGFYFQTNDRVQSIYIDRVVCERLEAGDVNIEVYLSTTTRENKNIPPIESSNATTLIVERDREFVYTMEQNATNNSCRFIVNFHLEGATQQMILLYGQPRHIADVVIDFGSEASQMFINNRAQAANINNIVPIFDNVKVSYEDENTNRNDTEYVQYETAELYKSRFYIPKTITEEVNANKAITPTNSVDDGLLKFLTVYEDEDVRKNYISLPNTKIAHFGGVKLPRITVGRYPDEILNFKGEGEHFFHRRAMSIFIREALRKIGRDHKTIQEGNNCFINFNLLMPNVYADSDAAIFISYIIEDIRLLLTEKVFDYVKGFEVNAISESDASLLGAIDNYCDDDKPAKGTFLILDAGKGTLDFSILDYDSERRPHKYKNICKSGIIGAGNAITYAFTLALLDELFSSINGGVAVTQEDIQRYIYGQILGLNGGGNALGQDPFSLYQLTKVVEKYKHNYNSKNIEGGIPARSESKEITIEGFNNWVENLSHRITDPNGYIKQAIEEIAHTVMEKIEEVSPNGTTITHIVFTGRGFCYNPLKQALLSKIKTTFGDNVVEFDFIRENQALTNKNICLYCIWPISRRDYNTADIGTPFIVGGNIATIAELDVVPIKKKKTLIARFWDSGNNNSTRKTKEERKIDIELCSTLTAGFTIKAEDLKGKTDMHVGGKQYPIPDVDRNGSDLEIFYDGATYYWRQVGNPNGFGSFGQRTNMECKFAFESLFPYVAPENATDIPVKSQSSVRQDAPEQTVVSGATDSDSTIAGLKEINTNNQ